MPSEHAAPAHHDPQGGFRNPWHTARFPGRGDLLRWWRERRTLTPDPGEGALPRAAPDIADPHAAPDELRATWVGHSTWLLQAGGLNLLTDPHWSGRAAPVQWAGPRRFTPPGVDFDALPPIDAVLLSHDHYDHLDAGTVDRIHARFGRRVRWFTPLGYGEWFAARGIRPTQMDWGEEGRLAGPSGEALVHCLPAQHWTSRRLWDRMRRLWCSWAITTPGGRRVYFGGDSGWFPEYAEIGERVGPLDLVLLPIGAYEPRWFMRASHMTPEEAVRAYRELGGRGLLGGMHWGTFRLTDEDPLEPPVRTRAAWRQAALPESCLWLPRHGETRVVGSG